MANNYETLMRLAQNIFETQHQRWGQALFNASMHVYPRAAELARGNPDLDPFHKDTNVNAFLEHVISVGE